MKYGINIALACSLLVYGTNALAGKGRKGRNKITRILNEKTKEARPETEKTNIRTSQQKDAAPVQIANNNVPTTTAELAATLDLLLRGNSQL